MDRRKSEVTTETKRNLMDAYWLLYTADMPSRITVKMITDRAGYNRGTFYAHFLDIEDLHEQIENELLPSEENFRKLREATLSKNSREILEIFMQEDQASGDKVSFLLGPRGSLNYQTKLMAKLKELILKYASLDLDEPEHIIDYKAEIVCSVFYKTIQYWYDRGRERFTGEEMIGLMLHILYFGLNGQVDKILLQELIPGSE